MPVVDKNQLKIWFKNLAKPVQEQFWNWMDSFYHKLEPIPKSAVENLTTDLAKKADLVGGVVPASQLPFSVNTSEVIAVGEISATENTVTLAVHSSGTNAVRINGVVLTRTFPNTFNFTPVTEGSKFLIIYAINDSGIFRLAEGVEDLEAVEPEIPVGALFVRRILINSAGADVELPTLTGFKEKKEDNWKVFLFSQTDAPVFLPFTDGRTSFLLLSQNSLAGNLILGGFARGQADANWWSGKELTILNNTGSNVSLQNIEGFDELTQATFRANYVLKNNETVKLKVLQDGDLLEVMALSIDISGKLDKGGYTGTAQDLKNDIDNIQNSVVDTSNLVPYTGANKDVNIASNYFKTSKGFDFRKDEDNYYRTFHNGNYNYLDFYSLDISEDNFGKVEFRINPEDDLLYQKQSVYGNNSFQVTTYETYTPKKYVTDEGYQIVNGTATQALTANGGTFDLDEKADLENGKVPASQLPSYVDDVLEFANLASFPTTGESGKIYIAIDTNLTYRWGGSSYVVMSSSLALGETSSTAYRGDRGNIAYNHSQLPGNPHGTKLEELNDVSGTDTTIADTDEILKKEYGGFWKKITFANFKNWFTTELAKKINIGLDTVFNFKNISAMTLNEFRSITPDIETIYFTEEQNTSGWQQIRYPPFTTMWVDGLSESPVMQPIENIELDSDSTFNLIDVENIKINGIFEKDFVIINFKTAVYNDPESSPNKWVKIILKINGVQTAVSPAFFLLEPIGTYEEIDHSFALNVTAEMVTHGATLHIKISDGSLAFRHPTITVVRVHKSTTANL